MSSAPAFAVASLALLSSFAPFRGCASSDDGDSGSLWIRIVSPSSEPAYWTDRSSASLGGDLGGWTIFDPAPTVSWRNTTTGEHGSTGQILGTFATGPIALVEGANILRVRASNGVQDDAVDSITVTYLPPGTERTDVEAGVAARGR